MQNFHTKILHWANKAHAIALFEGIILSISCNVSAKLGNIHEYDICLLITSSSIIINFPAKIQNDSYKSSNHQ